MVREVALAEIWNFVNDIDFARLENLDKTCDPDTFLETLLFTVKNESISYQSFIKKEKQKLIKMLCNNLAVAKTLTPQCQDTIAAMEARINIYFDNEMTKEIEKYSLFEHLNMEKMTPHFLKLAKCTRRRCGGIKTVIIIYSSPHLEA